MIHLRADMTRKRMRIYYPRCRTPPCPLEEGISAPGDTIMIHLRADMIIPKMRILAQGIALRQLYPTGLVADISQSVPLVTASTWTRFLGRLDPWSNSVFIHSDRVFFSSPAADKALRALKQSSLIRSLRVDHHHDTRSTVCLKLY